MNLEQRTTALLDVVDHYRMRRRAELLEPAQAEARQVVRTALHEARRRVVTAIAAERKHYAVEVRAIEAALATERRLAAQHHAVELLAGAWSTLRAKLIERWNTPATREQWTRAHLARALEAVPHGQWHIEHAAAWTAAERSRAAAELEDADITAVAFSERKFEAGFRVVAGCNVFDATLDGLIADRDQLEGRLLHLLATEHA
jgi:L-lactate utilization protein LutC